MRTSVFPAAQIVCIVMMSVAMIAGGCSEERSQGDEGKEMNTNVADAKTMPYDSVKIQKFRTEKDAYLSQATGSPIPAEERESFAGLPYFPPDSLFAPTADYEPFADPKQVFLMTTTGEPRPMLRAGTFSFALKGESLQLTAYKSVSDRGHLFVPFRDATNDSLTYGGGRYLDIPEQSGGTYTLDFNYAYSPYCAYNTDYSCPTVPVENVLQVEIRAGEMKYGTDDVKQNR